MGDIIHLPKIETGMVSRDTPVEKLSKIHLRLVKRLHHLGIRTVGDVLRHFPSRYDDFSNIKVIADLEVGELATIRVRVKSIQATRAWQKRMSLAEAVLEDETGRIRAVWFNQPYLAKSLPPGSVISLSGKLSKSKKGPYFANPAYERVFANEHFTPTPGISSRKISFHANEQNQNSGPRESSLGQVWGFTHTSGLVPVYPETTGVTSRTLRILAKQALSAASKIPDPLPAFLTKRFQLMPFAEALHKIHFPKTMREADASRRRFAFEDILLIQLKVLRDRKAIEEKRAPIISISLGAIKAFVSSLSFPLTNAQRKAAWEIVNDMAKAVPMNRLLEGDVGSGKTVVAALAALDAVSAGFQVAYLAPTEILAIQHFTTFKHLLRPLALSVGLLTGSQKKVSADFGDSEKARVGEMAERGEIDVVIGTHAVIQDKIHFKNLGLVIVDEQHRFGVSQRAHLQKRQTDSVPHFLSMTATPIPRTLALSVYGDLDLSILDQMPKGRKPIITRIVPQEKRRAAYEFIRGEVKKGRQVFVICPRIEIATGEMDQETRQIILKEEVKAVKSEYEKLSKHVFPDLRIAMLYGKMKPKEKEKVMREFKYHAFDILVSTSVVEVGVDVPNATVMLIDGAEKFGLAQIHQFRGRVGRGEHQSYCFLMTSSVGSEDSARLKAVVTAKNGFELAEKDLAIRGPGDFFGTRQSGIPPFAYKSFSDVKTVQAAREAAQDIIKKDSSLDLYPELKRRLQRVEAAVHWE